MSPSSYGPGVTLMDAAFGAALHALDRGVMVLLPAMVPVKVAV